MQLLKSYKMDELTQKALQLTGSVTYQGRRNWRIKAAIILVAIKYLNIKVTHAGRHLGLDHTTALYHRDQHERRLRKDRHYSKIYRSLVDHVLSTSRTISAPEVIELIKNSLTLQGGT